MKDPWTDRLSEYLDDELTAGERREIEGHLAGCDACTRTLADLRRVIEGARALTPRPPHRNLWSGIADRIDAASPSSRGATRVVPFAAREPRRISFTLPQLAAASLLLAAISGAAAWRLRTPAPEARRAAAESAAAEPAADAPIVEPVAFADAQYDSAVADLQRALRSGRGHLDPATIAIVEQNLTIIDRAIEQARQAVTADPGNSYLTSHLVETRRKKLDLLRRAAALVSETD